MFRSGDQTPNAQVFLYVGSLGHCYPKTVGRSLIAQSGIRQREASLLRRILEAA